MNKITFTPNGNIKSPTVENKVKPAGNTTLGVRKETKRVFELCTTMLQSRLPVRIGHTDTFDLCVAEFYASLQSGKDRFVSLPKLAHDLTEFNSNQQVNALGVGGL